MFCLFASIFSSGSGASSIGIYWICSDLTARLGQHGQGTGLGIHLLCRRNLIDMDNLLALKVIAVCVCATAVKMSDNVISRQDFVPFKYY